MRTLSLILSCALLAAGCSRNDKTSADRQGTDTISVEAKAVADGYVSMMIGTDFGKELGAWITEQNYTGVIDTFHTSPRKRWLAQLPCYETRTDTGILSVVYSFVTDGVSDPPKATLEQVLIYDHRGLRLTKFDQEVWDALVGRLTARFSDPLEPSFDLIFSKVPRPEPARMPRKPLQWQDRNLQLMLADDAWGVIPRKQTSLFLFAVRTQRLARWLHWEEVAESGFVGVRAPQWTSRFAEVGDSLRGIPTPFEVLRTRSGWRAATYQELMDCAQFTSSAERAGDPHASMFRLALFAAGASYSPPFTYEVGQTFPPGLDSLARMGVPFVWNGRDGSWRQSMTPLEAIAYRQPSTQWSELAFLILQEAGWPNERFRRGERAVAMAKRGEEFLARHPQSPYAHHILMTLGMAYETLWNLSTCQETGERPWAPVERNDEDARLKAMSAFKQFLSRHRWDGSEADVARYRLSRLSLEIGSGNLDYEEPGP